MGNTGGLIHDEGTEGFYMPNGELAFSRDRCYLPRLFWAIGGPRTAYGSRSPSQSSTLDEIRAVCRV